MNERIEQKIMIAQKTAQSGILQFLEEAEDNCVRKLVMLSNGGASSEILAREVAVLAELRNLQGVCVRQVKEGALAAARETGGQNGS